MIKDRMVLFILCIAIFFLSLVSTNLSRLNALAWSNGGYSENPSNPDYGTHDWIAEHALDWLPDNEKDYITTNLVTYLYGTELPDNPNPDDGIGDTTKHHIYYALTGALTDDSAAIRAHEEYVEALNCLNKNNLVLAAKTVGVMSHYIADMSVFGHVMSSGTDWGAEIHHSDYESYVNTRTNSYSNYFNTYLSFDGSLDIIVAYDAALSLAYDTTFDVDGNLTCVWMDNYYNWSNPTFQDRCGESLNLAVNYLTDVLHTLYVETRQNNPTTHVVINEVELNPPGNDNYLSVEEWVELYNPTIEDLDVSGWSISTTHGSTFTITLPQGTTIPANGYYVYGRSSQWLDNDDEPIVLQDSDDAEIDRTPAMSDNDNDDWSWQRYPNGLDTWCFRSSTKGASNGGEVPRDDVPPKITNAKIDPNLGPLGTIFKISADVSDTSGVARVLAYIQRPDEMSIATVTLTDLEDDGIFMGAWDSTGGSFGDYWVDIVATDISDNSKEVENIVSFTLVEVEKEPPNASFTYSPIMDLSIKDTINFEDTSTDPDSTIVSWSWDFGDQVTSDNQNPTHKYRDKGTYTVKLTIIDKDGLKDTKTQEIVILNLEPSASFSYSPETPTIDQYVTFTDHSEDPEGMTLSYSWDFDDGIKSNERNPGHIYENSGTFTVKLTVTDDEGAKGTSSITITVSKLSSDITCSLSSSEVKIGSSITFCGSISPSVSSVTVTLTFTKPDGSTFKRTITTDSDGSYSELYMPTEAGSWSIKASWEGDLTHKEAISQVGSFTVEEKPKGGIPGFPYESIMLGLGIGLLLLWMLQRRR